MTTYTIALTGHRPNKLGGYDSSSAKNQAIKQTLVNLIHEGLNHCDHIVGISGMALGADTLWAEALLDCQNAGLSVELHAYIPCQRQERLWPSASQNHWRQLCKQASYKKIFAEKYTPQCMQLRNQGMVDDADMLFAIYDGTPGGTQNTVKYAQRQHAKITVIDPDNYQIKILKNN